MRFLSFIGSFVIIMLLLPVASNAQFQVNLEYEQFEGDKINSLPNEQLTLDSLQVDAVVSRRLQMLYEQGYLAAEYSMTYPEERTILVRYKAGKVFTTARLSNGTINEEILNKIGYDARAFSNKPFSHQRIVNLLNSTLDYAENHGFPFASVRLDSIQIEVNEIKARINYQSGPLIVFDSLIVKGYKGVKPTYLMTHLGIYRDEPYEERLIQQIPNKVKLLSFVQLTESPEVIIKNGKCNVILSLEQRKVSRLDGILGILPNQREGGNVLITGQLNLDLHNLFSSGKRLAIEWQSFNANSQLLDALYYHPNLFKMPINVQGDFYLLKQDTTFINRKFGLELSLLSRNSNKVGFKTEFISSRLISTVGYEDATELPENADYNLNYYGLNYEINRFNSATFPTRGWGLRSIGSIGQKKIVKNPVFDDELYRDLDLNSLQVRIFAGIEKYWGINRTLLVNTRVSGGYLNGDNLFLSDLFRIGGLRTLRGFVENEFFVSSYALANIEFRALFSEDTYFTVFYDQSFIQEGLMEPRSVQYPFGLGAGFTFSTSAGIFNFVFALGKSEQQPLSIDFSKIHFGYVSRF